jgi:hypothetical protein
MERNGPARPEALAPIVEGLHSSNAIQRQQRAVTSRRNTRDRARCREPPRPGLADLETSTGESLRAAIPPLGTKKNLLVSQQVFLALNAGFSRR